jgi:hypothetical protein
MKRLLLCLSVVLLGVLFCVTPSHAACTLNPDDGPWATVKKYQTGKTKVVEIWECVARIALLNGNSICFNNQLNDLRDRQYVCISGEYRIELPMNRSLDDFYY